MAKQEKNVVGLAKGTTTRKTPSKPRTKTSTDKTNTKEKAKQVVSELLDDVPILSKKDGELLELDETPETQPVVKNVEWFEEQIEKLSTENEELRKLTAQPSASKNTEDNVINLFNEFQTEYFKHVPQFRTETTVRLNYVMIKMLALFPFLAPHKKF